MPHPFWQALFGATSFAAVAVLLFMAGHVSVSAARLSQLYRAQVLSHIADEIATTVVAGNPNTPLLNLSVLVVQQLVAARAQHDVTDARAIERAANAALVRHGAKLA